MNDKLNNLPKVLKLNLRKYRDLRYGENPHQKSAFYIEGDGSGFEQLSGIELSHNNVGDANHAWQLVCEFSDPTVAIIKHGNPSGICTRRDIASAFKLAYLSDTVSAFGGIIAVNRPATLELVEAMRGKFFELIVASDLSREVIEALGKKSKKLRVVKAKIPPTHLEFTHAFNGYLVQTQDTEESLLRQGFGGRAKWKVLSGKKPNRKTYGDLEFAWKVVKHVKSNAIVVAYDLNMLGMGTGQPNRVNSVKLALDQAFGGERNRTAFGKVRGAVLASDAFFPFEDSVDLAAKAGISTIIQPGGSINDERVIADAKKHNITMIFTGVRHFKH